MRKYRLAPASLPFLVLFGGSGSANARDISGTISSTLTITENSRLVGDVTCTVAGAPCIAMGASNITLDLNGFSITGPADAEKGCSGPTPSGGEPGIDVNAQTGVIIRGPGLVQQFRSAGINARNNSSGLTVVGVTTSTNCASGILIGGGSEHHIDGNVAVRNGSSNFPCGGIWLYGGASRSRLRANRTVGNGFSAQDNNFGIGLQEAGTNDNIVEDNTVVGNTNGLFLTAGVEGTIIRRNLVVGNPPVQIAVDHTANRGFDIKNLADASKNLFTGNVCLTAMNGPCPALESSLTATPNPIPITGTATLGMTTISWMAPGADAVEVRIGSPDGVLFARGGNRGSAQTGLWVPDGTTFYLQDVSEAKPLRAENTLATVVIRLQKR